eukprot:Seg1393.11 transcript_id=Seg1393.11/GoldUCD/mRNA.D3Y31 product="putative ubiquitin carboxyl-terminal hydrolase MINDY-4" protein_id=Seg1393.11/GoldUCD/D3Y31
MNMDDEDGLALFDKSKAPKLPDKFPGDPIIASLQLEDVLEEVTDEVDATGSTGLQKAPRANLPEERLQNNQRKTTGITKRIVSEPDGKQDAPKTFLAFRTPLKDTVRHSPHSKDVPVKDSRCSCQTAKDTKKTEEKQRADSLKEYKVSISEINFENLDLLSEQPNDNPNEPSKEESPNKISESNGEEQEQGRGSPKNENEPDGKSEADIGNEAKNEEDTETVKIENGLEVMMEGRPITANEAKNLRLALFGTLSTTFSQEWTRQSIRLNKLSHYALRYHKGTVESVMACIQAFVLKHALFGEMPQGIDASPYQISIYHKKCVVSALTDILWQAGMQEKAVVCLPTFERDAFYTIDMKCDGLIEKIQIYEFSEKTDLHNFIQGNIKFFEEDGRHGCVIFIYSLIMSRTYDKIREDLQSDYECLIRQEFCTQALINLLLAGKATPNVFNNSKELKNESGKTEIHYGINKRNEIGFLSYGEAEDPKKITVESMLKTPVFPIWVADLQSHTCVLFCRKRQLLSDWKLERRFDLFYYGGLPRHFSLLSEDIRLTIDTVRPYDPDDYDYEFSSNLEDTIRTKWQDCVIDWNGDHRF